ITSLASRAVKPASVTGAHPPGYPPRVISAQASAASGARTGRAGDSGGFRTRWALLISVAGGLALYASFPPAGLWPLAVLGPALLVLALTGRSLRGSFGCALVYGLAQFVPLLSWLINLAWYAFGGAPLLSFLIALTGAMLARAVLSRGDDPPQTPPAPGGATRPPRPPWAGHAPLLAAVATAGLVLAGGLLPADPTGGAPTAQVAAIQGNVPRARNLPQQLSATQVTQNHVDATLKLAAQVKAGERPAPDLVIWPENATDIDPSQNPSVYAQLSTAVAAIGKPILIGEVLNDPRRNVGQLWVPGRGPGTAYVKRQLVPFGEYIPFRGVISSFSTLPSLQPIDFTAGRQPVVFGAGKIRLGDVICYEVAFDHLVRSEVTAGANLLTVQSNDADFEIDGQLGETRQQTAMARIRAVESDRAVVYASTTGESTIIAPDGSLIAHSGVWQQAVLDARVPLVSHRTLATRVGAWPEYVIIMLTVLALAWAVVRALRPRR